MYDTTLLIEALENRLYYLLGKCPPEEYNAEEVKALINLLKEYAPERMPEPMHITLVNPTQQRRVIHITPDPPPDTKTIIGLIAVITCIVILILIALFGLN